MYRWFDTPNNDEEYLKQWKDAKSNFMPEQPIDKTWHVDTYERVLGTDESGEDLFHRAAQALFRYQYYPSSVMHALGEFTLEDRFMRPGDRILQRIRLLPGMEILTVNFVFTVINETRRKGFTLMTTEQHIEMGEWTALVALRPNHEVVLMVQAVSKPGPRMPLPGKLLGRFYQNRAHRLGLEYFSTLMHSSVGDKSSSA
jgi:uncharacterized protein (UPF0548 family)